MSLPLHGGRGGGLPAAHDALNRTLGTGHGRMSQAWLGRAGNILPTCPHTYLCLPRLPAPSLPLSACLPAYLLYNLDGRRRDYRRHTAHLCDHRWYDNAATRLDAAQSGAGRGGRRAVRAIQPRVPVSPSHNVVTRGYLPGAIPVLFCYRLTRSTRSLHSACRSLV